VVLTITSTRTATPTTTITTTTTVATLEIGIGVVDRLEERGEIGCVLDRPQAVERGPEELHVTLGQQSHGNDAVFAHTNSEEN
jgi:hypothetical protein